jgi:hypothetical protein
MFRHRFLDCVALLVLAAFFNLACGSSQRQIQSLSVSPAAANARDYPGGKIPFVATGHYSKAPTTVTPLNARWGVASVQAANGVETFGLANGAVSVDTNGLAQCTSGASGNYAVAAWADLPASAPLPCAVNAFGAPTCYTVLGIAHLTCP